MSENPHLLQNICRDPKVILCGLLVQKEMVTIKEKHIEAVP